MANTSFPISPTRGICPAPFYQETLFPPTGGMISGRFCMPVAQLGNITCCLSCPATDWTYSDGFQKRTEIANWVNVAALVVTFFLLVSFVILPVKWTHRHYLSVCLTIGVMFIEMAFIVPLAANPDQCYNTITPNQMKSDRTCAVSGAFLLFGGWAAVIWVFLRALSLHLQICWELVPGKKFFYSALFFGWAIPATGMTIALSLTGTSYRFGDVCHINHDNGLQDFWGPLLAFAAIALVLQFITIGYCVQVFIRNIMDDKATTDSSSALPQYSRSFTTVSARQTYRRVKKVVQLQWKGACVVLLIIGEVIFFSVVFVSMDNGAQIKGQMVEQAVEWGTCLFFNGGDKNACLPLAKPLVKPESLVLAVLICLGLSGFWLLIFLGRWSMILGWQDFIKTKLMPRHEFVSADARRLSNDPRTYEMLGSKGTPHLNIQSPDRAALSPNSMKSTPFSPQEEQKADYFGKATPTRAYVSPISSYSSPRPPSVSQAREWDPRSTHARGGPSATLPGVALSKDAT